MPNPFAALTPALNVLSTEGQVLPATGQAIVDFAAPDTHELYDRLTGGDQQVDGLWEAPSREIYRSVTPTGRSERHLFRYFLDGTTKIYFIGTLLEHERSSPVQIAQVGAAAVRRLDDGSIRLVKIRHDLALMLDKTVLSDILWNRLEAAITNAPLMGFSRVVLRNTGEDDEFTALSVKEPRSRGTHKANWLMRQSESAIAKEDLGGRTNDEWLIVDGSLGNEYLDWRGAPLVGVAKTFRRDHIFTLGSGPRAKTINLYALLADLGEGQRTAVFPRRKEGRTGLIAFWYVRLRPQRGLDYPLMGVVKVEMPCPTGDPVSTELADLLSGCLIGERSVTPHGRDGTCQ